MQYNILEWIKVIGQIIISWPMVVILFFVIFRKPLLLLIKRFIGSNMGKAEIGPLKIELGKIAEEGKDAVNRLNLITELMAESRLLELEITDSMFGSVFTNEQQRRMKVQIEQLKKLITKKDN